MQPGISIAVLQRSERAAASEASVLSLNTGAASLSQRFRSSSSYHLHGQTQIGERNYTIIITDCWLRLSCCCTDKRLADPAYALIPNEGANRQIVAGIGSIGSSTEQSNS